MHFLEKRACFLTEKRVLEGISSKKRAFLRANFYGDQELDLAKKTFGRVHAVSNQNFCHPAYGKVIFSGNFKIKTVQQPAAVFE